MYQHPCSAVGALCVNLCRQFRTCWLCVGFLLFRSEAMHRSTSLRCRRTEQENTCLLPDPSANAPSPTHPKLPQQPAARGEAGQERAPPAVPQQPAWQVSLPAYPAQGYLAQDCPKLGRGQAEVLRQGVQAVHPGRAPPRGLRRWVR